MSSCKDCGNHDHNLTFIGNDGPYCQSCLRDYLAEDRLTADLALDKLDALRYTAKRKIHIAESVLATPHLHPAMLAAYKAKLTAWQEMLTEIEGPR